MNATLIRLYAKDDTQVLDPWRNGRGLENLPEHIQPARLPLLQSLSGHLSELEVRPPAGCTGHGRDRATIYLAPECRDPGRCSSSLWEGRLRSRTRHFRMGPIEG